MADFFICHAHEDKEAIARPLAEALHARGYEVWYDEFTLRLGDSLTREIDRGLRDCRFGIVVLSPRSLAKQWPRREMEALLSLETSDGTKRILPVWHEVTAEEVAAASPLLAGRIGVSTALGLGEVVARIEEAVHGRGTSSGPPPPRAANAPASTGTARIIVTRSAEGWKLTPWPPFHQLSQDDADIHIFVDGTWHGIIQPNDLWEIQVEPGIHYLHFECEYHTYVWRPQVDMQKVVHRERTGNEARRFEAGETYRYRVRLAFRRFAMDWKLEYAPF